MSNVRRVYVEKKEAYAVKAKELQEEIKSYLGITSVTGVRVLIRYDVENISEATYQRALVSVFSEPPVDDIYEETFDLKGAKAFRASSSGTTSPSPPATATSAPSAWSRAASQPVRCTASRTS